MLTTEMKELIRDHAAASVATINDDGTPSVSPKATFVILDDETIAFGNIRSPGTVKNLEKRPAIELCFTDVILRRAVRVTGKGRFVRTGQADTNLIDAFRAGWPDFETFMAGFVVIKISAVEFILSPGYDRGQTEEEIKERFLKHFNSLYEI